MSCEIAVIARRPEEVKVRATDTPTGIFGIGVDADDEKATAAALVALDRALEDKEIEAVVERRLARDIAALKEKTRLLTAEELRKRGR